jgi:hypothetical protein
MEGNFAKIKQSERGISSGNIFLSSKILHDF